MSLPVQAEDIPRGIKGERMPCETPGCSERCSYAYSCHEQRMGRPRFLVWPLVALAILLVIGLLL